MAKNRSQHILAHLEQRGVDPTKASTLDLTRALMSWPCPPPVQEPPKERGSLSYQKHVPS